MACQVSWRKSSRAQNFSPSIISCLTVCTCVFPNTCVNYCLNAHFTEGADCPVYEKIDLRFITFSTVSSAVNILLLATTCTCIFVIIVIAVRWRKSQRDDASSGNESTEATAVYDEINLHPPSSANIDTRENVAYRQTIFS
jgi:cytochrome c oxidase assembly factor CtaG